nr:cysteine-rich receptor-like protein kinase [Tanacetum cinerariifolium]
MKFRNELSLCQNAGSCPAGCSATRLLVSCTAGHPAARVLGNGDSSSFWEDKWYAGGVIKELFPRLYALELHKHATVRLKLMAPSLDNSFRRRVRSGAEESQFNSPFDKPPENRARIDKCFPNVLSNDQRDDLERMVTKEEVKKAVWDCGSDKSLGPDGFSFSFFRHFWSTIKNDIFEVVDCFFTYGDMPNECNSNFIALIPKIIDANMVKDFRPISLIGSLYKVITKILTNRLVNVICDLVNEVQSAFVAERQILDGLFILNEDFQDSPDDDNDDDIISSQECLNDMEEEFQERDLLTKSKRFFKKGSQRFSGAKAIDETYPSQQKPEPRLTKDFDSKYNKVKAKLAFLSYIASSSKSLTVKNKGIAVESYELDEEDMSSDDNEMTEVKVLMALVDVENVVVGKKSARSGEWVKIIIKKVHTFFDMEDNDERKYFIDYLCIDLNYVEDHLKTWPLLNQKDTHMMSIFITMNLLKGARMLTRAMAKELSAASAHECLFVDFLSKEEPKKVSEAHKASWMG